MKLRWDSPGRVDSHDGKYHRERSADSYHTARWTRLSRAWRMTHPLCAECRKKGIVKPADVVDHIIPWPVCEDFYDTTNLQSLCADCNHAKGQRDKTVIAAWRRNHKTD